ncbi:MAG: PKD domain-containing protein [Euryarchaeota archaeon]|nr:PKD domain-containing protein [Euryarchaeota archaeon]MDE1836924.1 PKD domain-containing protein [Euryarchaeota archaeon]MDE1881524.1 PKD domain-containing protein [Euryarchaeota archaeon]MDE2045091.1 PKD domain-containing protein [Thermoplasmata archaeon]
MAGFSFGSVLLLMAPWGVPLTGHVLAGPPERGPSSVERPSAVAEGASASDTPSCTGCVVANITVGGQPFDTVYDRAKGEVFVTSMVGGNVTVISASTEKTVAGIPTGAAPSGIAYDPGRGELFVANANSNSISVINDSSNTVVASLTGVSNYLNAMGYDPGANQIFATAGNSLDVIADANNTILRNVLLNTDPYSVAYDSGRGELFVPCVYSDVYVVSDRTDTVVATIPVGVDPEGAVYDSAKGEIFVTNHGSNNVSVISDATDTVVANIPVGTQPFGLDYAPGLGRVFVANAGSQNLSEISDATNKVVGGTPLPSFPNGLAYDASTNQVYVGTNTAVGTESVINEGSSVPLSVTASANTTYGPAWFHTNFTEVAAGGTGSYTSWVWHFGDGTTSAAPNPSHTYLAKGNYTVWVNITDSSAKTAESNPVLVTVEPPLPLATLTGVTVSPVSAILAPGGSQSFTATPTCTGGPCPAGTAYAWSMNHPLGSFNATTGSVVKFTAGGSAGITYLFVNATLNGVTVSSSAVLVRITSTPQLYSLTLLFDPSVCTGTFNGTYASNNSQWVAKAGNYPIVASRCPGFTFYNWSWSFSTPGGWVHGSSASNSTSLDVLGNGTVTATYVWGPAPWYTLHFFVHPFPCQPVDFNGTYWSNATTGYYPSGTYLAKDLARAGCTPTGWVWQPARGPGQSFATAWVNISVSSNGTLTEIYNGAPPPGHYTLTFSISPSPCGPVSFNGTSQTNGTSASFLGSTYAARAPACASHPFRAWLYAFPSQRVAYIGTWVNVSVGAAGTLFANYTASGPPPPLSVSLSANATSATVGSLVRLTPTVSGGAPPYACAWSLNSTNTSQTGCTAATLSWSHPGTYTYRVWATDSATEVAGSNAVAIAVRAPSRSSPPPLVAFANETVVSPWSCTTLSEAFAFAGNARGGVPAYSFFWIFTMNNSGASGRNATLTYTYGGLNVAGTQADLQVADSSGHRAWKNLTVSFGSPSQCPAETPPTGGFSFLGLSPTASLLLIAGVLAAILAAVVVLVVLRRRRGRATPPEHATPPPGSPGFPPS